jgi:hypothetical protein
MRRAHVEEARPYSMDSARLAGCVLSGGALDSGERRRRWGQRFQVDRVRDEYSP